MNTILTILLLIALTIAIVCDIIRIWQYTRSLEETKRNVKETVCDALDNAFDDWTTDPDSNLDLNEYFRENFNKYI